EEYVHAGFAAEFLVAGEVARVAGQVFRGCELGGIDVDADHHLAARADDLPGALDEAEMAGMQIAHREDEADGYAASPPVLCQPLHGGRRSDHSHPGKFL